jgi:hypothetical protein
LSFFIHHHHSQNAFDLCHLWTLNPKPILNSS